MKKILVLLLAIVICLAFAACGNNGQKEGGSIGMANPLQESSVEEIYDLLGFNMVLPAEAEDINYAIISMSDDKNGIIAQASFVLDGKAWQYRVCKSVNYSDISGLYYDWANVLDCAIGDYYNGSLCYNAEGAGYCGWYDTALGMIHNVAITQGAGSQLLADMANDIYYAQQPQLQSAEPAK